MKVTMEFRARGGLIFCLYPDYVGIFIRIHSRGTVTCTLNPKRCLEFPISCLFPQSRKFSEGRLAMLEQISAPTVESGSFLDSCLTF